MFWRWCMFFTYSFYKAAYCVCRLRLTSRESHGSTDVDWFLMCACVCVCTVYISNGIVYMLGDHREKGWGEVPSLRICQPHHITSPFSKTIDDNIFQFQACRNHELAVATTGLSVPSLLCPEILANATTRKAWWLHYLLNHRRTTY